MAGKKSRVYWIVVGTIAVPALVALGIYGVWNWATALPPADSLQFRESATDVGITWQMRFLRANKERRSRSIFTTTAAV